MPYAFISFLVFGNPDETLALVLKYYLKEVHVNMSISLFFFHLA